MPTDTQTRAAHRPSIGQRLLCVLGRHAAQPPILRNRKRQFARCAGCGCDLTRTDGPWRRPKGKRIVWPDHPPPAEASPALLPVSVPGHQPIEPIPPEPAGEARKERAAALLLDILESLTAEGPAAEPPSESDAKSVERPEPDLLQSRPDAPDIAATVDPMPPEPGDIFETAPPAPAPAAIDPVPAAPEPEPMAVDFAPAASEPGPSAAETGSSPAAASEIDDFMLDDGSDSFSWESEMTSSAPVPPAALSAAPLSKSTVATANLGRTNGR